tara:strand:- start:11373 stop:11624 length:252 start_codon:yes stop_codon:yes gene_type:complete
MASLWLDCNLLEKIGTKALLNAPSAKILRKKLGSLKAAKNTSDKILTPIYLAIKTSLIKPKMRDIRVRKEKIEADFITFLISN